VLFVKTELGTTSTSWSQHHFVAIRNPVWHVRKASHWQQATIEITWQDHSIIACSRHMYCSFPRTSRSWWITHSTQHHRRDCNSTNPDLAFASVGHDNWLPDRSLLGNSLWSQ